MCDLLDVFPEVPWNILIRLTISLAVLTGAISVALSFNSLICSSVSSILLLNLSVYFSFQLYIFLYQSCTHTYTHMCFIFFLICSTPLLKSRAVSQPYSEIVSLQFLFWFFTRQVAFLHSLRWFSRGFCLVLWVVAYSSVFIRQSHWGCLQTSGEASTFSSPEGSGSVQKQFFLCGSGSVDFLYFQSQALLIFAGVLMRMLTLSWDRAVAAGSAPHPAGLRRKERAVALL